MSAVRSQIKRRLCSIIKCIYGSAMCFQADAVNASVGSHAACHFTQLVVDTLVVEVKGFGFAFFCGQAQPSRDMIYGNHTFRPKQIRTLDRELPDGPATP